MAGSNTALFWGWSQARAADWEDVVSTTLMLHSVDMTSFPPEDIVSFLNQCCGDWLVVRSLFTLGESGADGEDDAWHSSERGELSVVYMEPEAPGEPGGLEVTPPGGAHRMLTFLSVGRFQAGGLQGALHLCPDGSLELTLRHGPSEVIERIWFTKPNLRLRSSLEHRADGTPARASFSSEIRRLKRPPVPPIVEGA